jgi:hypothetical protein
MYMGRASKGAMKIYGASFLQDGHDCVAELVVQLTARNDPPALASIDHFTIDSDGLIERFVEYLSPERALPRGVLPEAECPQQTSQPPTYSRSDPKLIAPAHGDDGSRPACKGPRKYLELMDSGRWDEIGSLYAQDVVFYGPFGDTYHGRDTVHKMYSKAATHGAVRVYGASFLQDGNHCIAELVVRLREGDDPYAMTAIDNFTVDEKGLIKQFVVYLSPDKSVPPGVIPAPRCVRPIGGGVATK